ncbi:endonuclease/exonuclease/phosphatase family protein [Paenibacillus ginsengarvi]|uniref:Endonuclease n=1 Tax=Paenibacillus ginsengarvi TaxID=400777 RepID=A0A3B0CLU3_9BACL|nr:endonuclease/exonuclease/phosphatase family protein [Paenibacillus ginsengarvi]RKN86645.1 endonuclease [Paenibacillus ginsengarvi]
MAKLTIKLMSYNIHFGTDSSGAPTLPRIMETIAEAGPDIVFLQEVDKHWSRRSGFADQTKLLSETLGLSVVYGANLDLDPPVPGAPRRQYGTAILSKHPIMESRNYPLNSFGDEQRGLLEAEIELSADGPSIRAYNIHMGLTARQRIAQVEDATQIIGRKSGPVVLAGDFNAEPDSLELRLLREAGFVDSLAGLAAGPTFPSTAPESRIDYIWTRGNLSVDSAAVLPSMASDHCPIVGEYVMSY